MTIGDAPLLEEAFLSFRDAKSQSNPADWPDLSGFFGLTGSCIGYSVHTAERVDSWTRSGACSSEGKALLPPVDIQHVEHYEKLLLSAVFRSLGKKDDPREIRMDWDPQLYAKIHRTYQVLIESQARFKTTARLPEQGVLPIQEIGQSLEIVKNSKANEHYIIAISKPDQSIFDSHALYLHPNSGTIADAGVRCLWHIPKKAHSCFMDVVKNYLKGDYQGKNFCMYKIERLHGTSSSLPRSSSILSTSFHMMRYKTSLAARYTLVHLLPQRWSYLLSPNFENNGVRRDFYASLTKDFFRGSTRSFLKHVRKREHRIWAKSEEGCLLEPLPKAMFKKAFYLLEELSKMGQVVEPVSAWLLQSLLYATFPVEKTTFSKQEVEDLRATLRKTLDYRNCLSSSHRVDLNRPLAEILYRHELISLVEILLETRSLKSTSRESISLVHNQLFYTLCYLGQLNLLKTWIEQKPLPENSWYEYQLRIPGIPSEFFREAKTPLAAAEKARHSEVVSYLSTLKIGGSLFTD